MNKARWIWKSAEGSDGYNEYLLARKRFRTGDMTAAHVSITADTWYRLYINGIWVGDGPCRSWSNHLQYDVIDVAGYLVNGENEIRVLARHYGTGVFQRNPIRGGLLVQLDGESANGEPLTVATDGTWEVSTSGGWIVNTPKVGLGMEPFEAFDACHAGLEFSGAEEIADSASAPWRDLHPRDVPLLTRLPFPVRSFLGANVVNSLWQGYTFSLIRLLYPGLKEGEGFTTMAAVAATLIVASEEMAVGMEAYPAAEGPGITVNGGVSENGRVTLRKGENLLLLFFEPWGHHNKEQGVRFIHKDRLELRNPSDGSSDNPWDFVSFEDLKYHEHDDRIREFNPPERQEAGRKVQELYRRISESVHDKSGYQEHLSSGRSNTDGRFPIADPHWQFECREVIENEAPMVENPEALILEDGSSTIVQPSEAGDVELHYDLGEQNCGYFEFEVEAESGTIIDLFAVEFICSERGVQHTWSNRNGLRYICTEGRNHHLSLKRRSGRYLYLTLRNQSAPVKIRLLRLVESTFPVNKVASFVSSDEALNEIWNISERTLKLCMEDVFTDCPLYEQTLWVGDARNEGLFAMVAYSNTGEIVKRCIRLAAQGLEHFPIIPSHVPTSSSDAILPAWTFLWGISIWDYYFYSGDRDFLSEIWPSVIRNLEGAERLRDERGLFAGPFWNMFDWTGVDIGHLTVTHNSMLLKGSLDALVKCAEVLGDEAAASWMRRWSRELTEAINLLWDDSLRSYVDSVHEDGSLSSEICIHTNFIALLYEIIPEDKRSQAVENVLNPRAGMTTLGSPFAMLYLYETLDKLGYQDDIINSIRQSYQAMLDVKATTVWEQFADGNAYNPEGFPTRSHCHAWSSSPILYLNLAILGIRQVEVGGASFIISPRLNHCHFARGSSASAKGPVHVCWEKSDDVLDITVTVPAGVSYQFVRNETMTDIAVRLNGQFLEHAKDEKIIADKP